jgi:hypothetical protein
VFSYVSSTTSINKLFKNTLTIFPDSNIDDSTKVILSNHKSFADFFIDNQVVGKNTCYLSRLMVIPSIPFSALLSMIHKNTYYFNRSNKNPKQIYNIIELICKDRILILYPEGTRNPTNTIIPLKKGCLHSIYEQNLQLQIMNISNKEKVLSEKKLQFNYNVNCNILICKTIIPSNYDTFVDFYKHICNEWEVCWQNKQDETCIKFKPHEDIYVINKSYQMIFPVFLTSLAIYNMNYFVNYMYVFYFGLILCWNNIAHIDKKYLENFIYKYNNFQILLSSMILFIFTYNLSFDFANILNSYNFTHYTKSFDFTYYTKSFDFTYYTKSFDFTYYTKSFDFTHYTKSFDFTYYTKSFDFTHYTKSFDFTQNLNNIYYIYSFVKLIDFIDTILSIVLNEKFTISQTYQHITIGFFWLNLYNNQLIKEVYYIPILINCVINILYRCIYKSNSYKNNSLKNCIKIVCDFMVFYKTNFNYDNFIVYQVIYNILSYFICSIKYFYK